MSSGRFVDGAEVDFKVDVNEGVDGVVVDVVDVDVVVVDVVDVDVVVDVVDVDGVTVDVGGVDGAVVDGGIVDGVEVCTVVPLDGSEVVSPFTGQLRTVRK
jgi:hypothetical protein